MTPEQILLLIEPFLGSISYIILAAALALLFKKYIEGLIDGLIAFFGNDLDEDDIVYIDGRKARVARIGPLKTIFYMYDTNTKWPVQNKRLAFLRIEKKLSTNGHGLKTKD